MRHRLSLVSIIVAGVVLLGIAWGVARTRVSYYDLSVHVLPQTYELPSMYEGMSRGGWILCGVAVVLAIVSIVFAIRTGRYTARHFVLGAIYFIGMVCGGYYVSMVVARTERFVPVQAFITDPATGESYEGVDATVDTTTIRIDRGGTVAFDAVGTRHGVSLAHKDFHRRVVVLPQALGGKPSTLYLSADFINALIAVLDIEARGTYDRIYAQLPVELQAEVSLADFFTSYKPLMTRDDLSDQEVIITSIMQKPEVVLAGFDARLSNAYELVVTKSNRRSTYYLVRTDDGIWRVVP